MSNLATEALLEKRQKLINKRVEVLENIDNEIDEIEKAIEQLSGKKVWDVVKEEKFDDENPDYIKSSIED